MHHIFRRPGQSVPEESPRAGAASDPWVSSSGVVAHPDAPVGGGGPGFFRGASSLGSSGDLWDAVPHPQAPAARNLAPEVLDDKAEKLEQPAQQPAPVVAADEKKTVAGIEVTIKADKKQVKGISGAHTATDFDSGAIPEAEFDLTTKKVTKLLGPKPTITAVIQTSYGSGSSPDGRSAYGRGTTDDDKKKGNTSLGFHESCHRQDYLDYLKANALPTFTGKVGMTPDEWTKAGDKYEKAVEDYGKKASAYSGKQTDDVGDPTKSQYDAK
jgi:hypothetical protein